jgi:hypothetical protein
MHNSDPVNQVAPGMETNEACYQCHGEMRSRLQEHTHHPPESSGSLCYNCHMPYTVYGLLKSIRSHQIDSPSAATTIATGRPNACNLCHLDRPLGWTADHLSSWRQQKRPPLPREHEEISAALLNLLKGDAGQRALIANAMGWQPAREASGHDWLAPYLGVLLQDPYSAVRYIAHRSLRSLPGEYRTVPYDFVGAPNGWQQAGRQIAALWKTNGPPQRTGPALLLRADGNLDETTIHSLLQQRDNRSMDLQE